MQNAAVDSNRARMKAIVAGSVGNLVEWFDFSIYAIFATMIAANFFALEGSSSSLLATFATFAVGFLMRPLGAIVIGAYGDRAGRKKALGLTIIIMGIGTLMIGIIPTHDQIGIWAPILLIVARFIQGFSAGGEWGGSSTYIVESADNHSRGFWGSWQQVSTSGGMLLGSLTGVLLTSVMSNEALLAWGWRIPFIAGGLLGFIGLYMRRGIEETPEFTKAQKQGEISKVPFFEAIRNYRTEIMLGMGINIFWTVAYYGLLTFMPTFLSKFIGLSAQLAFLASTISMVVLMVLIPIMGHLSDRIGRKPLMLVSTLGCIILTYPLFLLIASGSFLWIILAEIIFCALIAMYAGPGVAAIVEIFPTKVRYSSLSIGYNISGALFGGTAPFLSTYLINQTGSYLSPAFYIIFASVVTSIIIWRMNFNRNQLVQEQPSHVN